MAPRKSFRIGRVRGDLRSSVWYLTYHDQGRRHRPRVGPDQQTARQLAAQINGQLETGAPAALSFEPILIGELQQRWLDHHEQVLRSSVHTISRYRTASAHLLRFIAGTGCTSSTAQFRTTHAEQFVRWLRTIRVTPNGHPNSQKRPLLDKGIKYILQCCRSLFQFAIRRRHLSPYAENPFTALDLDRIPVENSRRVVIFTADQERAFLEACDSWQFPLFLTLMLTGLRPGELTHLLLPDDLDLDEAVLRVRNKPELGWQVKTRNERTIPLIGPLVDALRSTLGSRCQGPVFRRRRFSREQPLLPNAGPGSMEREINSRIALAEAEAGAVLSRQDRLRIARTVWRDAGMVKSEQIRKEFMRLTRTIGLPHMTAPKSLRHLFATCLQDANVDPLIRCELMGHTTGTNSAASHGLGMTANYTQTRFETKRRQLEQALLPRPAVEVARARTDNGVRRSPANSN
ncbi:MAG: tyrosine-type recombinase/integrase [Planctomycetaceae bacterium]|nr:tyrosine-type recombinase/integrase [Planctomycetaceae bacterium]